MHVIAAKAVCFKEALQPEFKEYAKMIVENAQALCKGLQKRGIDIVSGGTDNHLMLVDLRSLGVTGKQMENLLDEVNITCNKNAIPNDPQCSICYKWCTSWNSGSYFTRDETGRHGQDRRSNRYDSKRRRKPGKSESNRQRTYRQISAGWMRTILWVLN